VDIQKFVSDFFDDRLLSPHGICLLWRPGLLWTHVIADTLIGLSYYSIPFALGFFLVRRRDLSFGWMGWLFALFIILCGATHFFAVLTLWAPLYGVEALLKLVTAFASVITALMLAGLTPKLIKLPSPEMLQRQVAETKQALEAMDRAYAELAESREETIALQEHHRKQLLLIGELNHRVKNTLAAVQSIAKQTLRGAESKEAFAETFESRLMALSQTHNILVEQQWESASFREMTERLLSPYGRNYTCDGRDIDLPPSLAVSIGMALHELATNAAKYGAWTTEDGLVTVSVKPDAKQVCIAWEETGGPTVRKPEKTSFGTRLLTRGVPTEFGGQALLEYRPEGIVYSLCFPIEQLVHNDVFQKAAE
jgi:two-component sensor histidine kinase